MLWWIRFSSLFSRRRLTKNRTMPIAKKTSAVPTIMAMGLSLPLLLPPALASVASGVAAADVVAAAWVTTEVAFVVVVGL